VNRTALWYRLLPNNWPHSKQQCCMVHSPSLPKAVCYWQPLTCPVYKLGPSW
jgi:hypothetical protein